MLARRQTARLRRYATQRGGIITLLDVVPDALLFEQMLSGGGVLVPSGGTFDSALGFETDGVNEHAETSSSVYTNSATPALTVTMRPAASSTNAHIAGEDEKAYFRQHDSAGRVDFVVFDSVAARIATASTPLQLDTDYTLVGWVDANDRVNIRVYDANGLFTSGQQANPLLGVPTLSTKKFTVGARDNGGAAYAGYVRQVLAADAIWDVARADAIAAVLQPTLSS